MPVRDEVLGGLASLIGHLTVVAWLFTATPPVVGGPQPPPSMEVDLIRAPVPEAEPEAPKPGLPPEKNEAREPEASPPPPPPAPPPPRPRKPAAPRKPASAEKSPAEAAGDGPSTPDSPPVEAVFPAAPAAAAPPASSPGGIDEDSLRVYGQLVWAWIMRAKPRDVQVPGTSLIRFALTPDGTVAFVEIAESSGKEALDRLAVETVGKASPFPPPPAGAGASQLTFTIPFQFR